MAQNASPAVGTQPAAAPRTLERMSRPPADRRLAAPQNPQGRGGDQVTLSREGVEQSRRATLDEGNPRVSPNDRIDGRSQRQRIADANSQADRTTGRTRPAPPTEGPRTEGNGRPVDNPPSGQTLTQSAQQGAREAALAAEGVRQQDAAGQGQEPVGRDRMMAEMVRATQVYARQAATANTGAQQVQQANQTAQNLLLGTI